MTLRTFSSILPFTRRFGVRGVTCMTNGAQGGGGGPTSDSEMSADDMYQRGLAHYEQEEFVKAAEWFRRAEDRSPRMDGHPEAQLKLGQLFQEGKAVPWNNPAVNFRAAVDFYGRAANRNGNKEAQFRLGKLYEGIKAYAEACFWFSIAAMSGHPEAEELQRKAASCLSPSEARQFVQTLAKEHHAQIQAWCNR